MRAEVTLEGGRAPGRGWKTASAPVAFSHFRGGAEVALFCFKMAAGMYLEHYLDSKSRWRSGSGVTEGWGWGFGLRSSMALKSRWSESHNREGLRERKYGSV